MFRSVAGPGYNSDRPWQSRSLLGFNDNIKGLCPTFYQIWNGYPPHHVDTPVLLTSIGLGWLTNSCAVRTTIGLGAAGLEPGVIGRSKWIGTKFKIDSNDMPVRTRERKRYLIRVAEVEPFLRATFGPPVIRAGAGELTNKVDEQGNAVWRDNAAIFGYAGIIHYSDCGWTDATGHFDVWDGTQIRNHGYPDKCKKVEIYDVCRRVPNPDYSAFQAYMRRTKAAVAQ